MRTSVMVPVRGAQDARSVAGLVQSLLDRDGVGKVTLVRVVPYALAVVGDYVLDPADVARADAEQRAQGEAFLRDVAGRVRWGSTDHEIVALLGDEPDALTRFAARRGFDLIVMASPKRTWLGRVLAGNLIDRTLDAVGVPITVLPDREPLSQEG